MAHGKSAWLLGGLVFALATRSGADDRGHVAGKFALDIGGKTAGWVMSVEGGSGVKDLKAKAQHVPTKIYVRNGDSEALWDWVATTLATGSSKKAVSVQKVASKRRVDMVGAAISEIKFPKLDAKDGKKHIELVVQLQAESIEAKDVANTPPPPAGTGNAVEGLTRDFRVRIGGSELSGVTKVDSFTWKQKVSAVVLTMSAESEAQLKAGAQKKKRLDLELTSADGTVWKTLSFSGIALTGSKAAGKDRSVTLTAAGLELK